jgi:hypothetical protein
MSDIAWTNQSQDKKLAVRNWMREHSTPMWLGVDKDSTIVCCDERLPKRLGQYAVHTNFLGTKLDQWLDIPGHAGMVGKYIENGSAPLSLTRQNPNKFNLVDIHGEKHHVLVRIQIKENVDCDGWCELGQAVDVHAMAEIMFIEDLSDHIINAYQWYIDYPNWQQYADQVHTFVKGLVDAGR